MFWNDRSKLTDCFREARKIVHSWNEDTLGDSYQGFFKQVRAHGRALQEMVITALRMRMLWLIGQFFPEQGFQRFAIDGSRVGCPRTKSNQRYFCRSTKQKAKSKRKTKSKTKRKAKAKTKRKANQKRTRKTPSASDQKKANSPQAWVTVMSNLTLGLPWDFRTGPSGSSERAHLMDMISTLPKNALITADAGFTGYEYWNALQEAQVAFVIRVGASVKLLKNLGVARSSGDWVFLWPDQQQRRQQPPLTLRLVSVRDGDQQVFLVTNVLDMESLHDEEIVSIYRERWQVELYYRTFKQIFGTGRLRCREAKNAVQELNWSLISLWVSSLYATHLHLKETQSVELLSPAGVIQAFVEAIRQWQCFPEEGDELDELILAALKDEYVRKSTKTNKEYPRKKRRKPPGAPGFQQATPEQQQQAAELTPPTEAGIWLTA